MSTIKLCVKRVIYVADFSPAFFSLSEPVTMRSPTKLSPLTEVAISSDQIHYELKFIQSPRNSKESLVSLCPPVIRKRLVHPFPILSLKIFETRQGQTQDITDRVLSLFYLRASLVNADSESLIGTSTVSGNYYDTNRRKGSKENGPNGVFVFLFNDLGVLQKGEHYMKFELFKIENYNYLSCATLPFVCKVTQLVTSEIVKIYGSREYYEEITQVQRLEKRTKETQKAAANKVYRYMASIGLVRVSACPNEKTLPKRRSKIMNQNTKKAKRIATSESARETSPEGKSPISFDLLTQRLDKFEPEIPNWDFYWTGTQESGNNQDSRQIIDQFSPNPYLTNPIEDPFGPIPGFDYSSFCLSFNSY